MREMGVNFVVIVLDALEKIIRQHDRLREQFAATFVLEFGKAHELGRLTLPKIGKDQPQIFADRIRLQCHLGWISLGFGREIQSLAFAVERLILRPLVNQPDIILFMSTFGLTYFLIGFGELIFGGETKIMIANQLGLPRGAIDL